MLRRSYNSVEAFPDSSIEFEQLGNESKDTKIPASSVVLSVRNARHYAKDQSEAK